MDLKLDHHTRDGIEVVDVEGEIDVYTAPRLRELLIELVNNGHYQLVVNMEKVEFLDSTGLGVLVGGLKRVRAHDGSLDLVCTQERILKIFRITGLTKVFGIHDTRGRGHHRPEVGEVAADRAPGPAMATVEMSFTPLPVHVRTARLVATAVARRSGVDEALLDEVRLAVGEACSRAVEAHQAQCPDEPVRVELTGANGRFEVVVTDAAEAGQDDGDQPVGRARGLACAGRRRGERASPADHRCPPQGLGLAVIAGLADDVQFARTRPASASDELAVRGHRLTVAASAAGRGRAPGSDRVPATGGINVITCAG